MSKMIHLGESLSISEDDLRTLLKDAGYVLIPRCQVLTCYAEEIISAQELLSTKAAFEMIVDHTKNRLYGMLEGAAIRDGVRFSAPRTTDYGIVYRAEIRFIQPDAEQ